MEDEITVETLPWLGVCILCLEEGAVKSMMIAHKQNGVDELYNKMLYKCYSIDVTALELGDTKHLICERCIEKLRDAVNFREQVESALSTLETTLQIDKSKELVQVKTEPDKFDGLDDVDFGEPSDNCEDVGQRDNDDVNADIMDIIIKTEEPNTEPKKIIKKKLKMSKTKPRRLKLTIKKYNPAETDEMLKAGLFPFKMHQNGTFSCAVCPEKSTNLEDLKTHVECHKPTSLQVAFHNMTMFSKSNRFFRLNNKLRCQICTGDVENYDQLTRHIANCVQLKYKVNYKLNTLPFKLEKDQVDCPVCKKTFLNFVSLNTHMNVHYPNYICENCGKAFASNARLRGHIRTHEVGEFRCKYCDAVFDRVTKRENHVSKEHKAGYRYACKRCNINLTSFYARQKHLAEVHNEELKRYKCKACPQRFVTPGHLSSHVRRDHLNERNHKCDKCDLVFYTKNALKMHMIKHDGERIYSCNICLKSYQRKKTLREHMRIHDNDKRFVCPECGRAFTQKCTLKGHMKVHERKLDADESAVHSI